MYASIARQFTGLKLSFDLFVLNHDEYIDYKDGYSFVHEMATTGNVYEKRDALLKRCIESKNVYYD